MLTPLDEESARTAVGEARRQGAEAIGVCFIHSYANPGHERRATEVVREEWPEVAVTASHELMNEWREYDRTSTVVLDAYMKPTAGRYLDALAFVVWLDDLAGRCAAEAKRCNLSEGVAE